MLSAINEVQDNISLVRTSNSIKLVAVSKGQSVGKILEAYSYGIRDFGESYVWMYIIFTFRSKN